MNALSPFTKLSCVLHERCMGLPSPHGKLCKAEREETSFEEVLPCGCDDILPYVQC